MRIVSLLPGATEIVCDLGLADRLVGISHACDYPARVADLPRVTSSVIPKDVPSAEIDRTVRAHLADSNALYALDLERLEALQPDVIVSQALCDVCAVSGDDVEAAVAALPGRPAVINLEPSRLDDVLATVRRIGEAAGVARHAAARAAALDRRVHEIAARSARSEMPRVALLEWIDPPFNAGHWNPELIGYAGGIDCLGNAGEPSRTVTWDDICRAAPEVLIVACCGYSEARARLDLPLLTERPGWHELPCARARRVHVCDGSAYFSRPGPRLVDGLAWLARALHPPRYGDRPAATPRARCAASRPPSRP